MKHYFLSGYYGFGNAGDEAVLAAILEALGAATPGASQFTVASGNPSSTVARYDGSEFRRENGESGRSRVLAVGRQNPKELARAIRACDVFISGGGSLLQDVTSLRNVVYYTSLIRFARLARKPIAIYAQGVGPLRRPISRKLARAAVQLASIITVRDEASKKLLQRIGVRKNIEVTADPVWALRPDETLSTHKAIAVALRPFPGYAFDAPHIAQVKAALKQAKEKMNAPLRFVPMQCESDAPLAELLCEADDVVMSTQDIHPRTIMAMCGNAHVMLAMRLHALIFAAAQGIPCVAVNYDPKVQALAALIGAPLLPNLNADALRDLPRVLSQARPLPEDLRRNFHESAHRTARLIGAC